MDDALLDRCREAGVQVFAQTQSLGATMVNARVAGLRLRDSSGGTSEIAARMVIDATGRGRSVSRHFDHAKPRRADFVAFKSHLADAYVEPGSCEIYSYPGGYGGSSLVEGGRHNICFVVSSRYAKEHGGDADALLRNVVFQNKRAHDVLRDSRAIEPWLAVPIERYGRSSLSPANGLIAVGDAAAFIDPFTGSGILLALESAKIAAASILAAEALAPEQIAAIYSQAYSRTFDSRLRLCSVLRHAAFMPSLSSAVIRLLSLNQAVAKRLAVATRGA